MANYELPLLQGTITTTYKTAGILMCNTGGGATARRIMVYEIEMGQTGPLSSTDCQVQWDVSRFSATNALVATAVVPNLMDGGDVSPLTLAWYNVTTELTYTGVNFGLSIKNWGINQRGSYRWRALDDGDNIIVAATGGNGVGIRALSSNFVASCVGNVSFVER
jgi:hypothetical protein